MIFKDNLAKEHNFMLIRFQENIINQKDFESKKHYTLILVILAFFFDI
jgi:hypothetical protein